MNPSEMPVITSLQNPIVKEVVKLQQKASERSRSKTFVIEGVRETIQALRAGITLRHVFLCPELYEPDPVDPLIYTDIERYIKVVSPAVFTKMAYRGSVGGLLAVADWFDTTLDTVQLSVNPLVIVLESVEKPGNLGAVLRTADAVGADAVVICDPRTDVFNPNVIRSSLGCVFTVKTAVCHQEEYFNWSGKQGLANHIASVQATGYYFDADFRRPTALVFGTESDGLSAEWYRKADLHLKIPMLGKADSLNVSVSVAVISYEVVRQRAEAVKQTKGQV